jgi:hypothetical protein
VIVIFQYCLMSRAFAAQLSCVSRIARNDLKVHADARIRIELGLLVVAPPPPPPAAIHHLDPIRQPATHTSVAARGVSLVV